MMTGQGKGPFGDRVEEMPWFKKKKIPLPALPRGKPQSQSWGSQQYQQPGRHLKPQGKKNLSLWNVNLGISGGKFLLVISLLFFSPFHPGRRPGMGGVKPWRPKPQISNQKARKGTLRGEGAVTERKELRNWIP